MDILIITFLIYSFLIFIRRTKSYMVFFGLAIAAGLYILAETFNLYLTFLTLRYFVGVSILIFVIIFQNEIRKYFEFLGLIGTRQIKVGRFASQSPTTSDLIQACVRMAQDKIGALIVIQGKDNLDSYIEGGTSLDGLISEELLLSIFDPHSDGHDGALIISNNRITKFGAHLPLSTNFKEIGKHGTRHSAALGLTENTDALCIVVSEEKGKISIARDGKLKLLSQFIDLEKVLAKYSKEKFGVSTENFISYFVKHNLGLKVGALAFSIIIWFFTAYQAGIIERTYSVPITLNQVPESTIVQSYSPKELRVKVSGRGDSSFNDIDADDFKVNVDAADLQNGINEKTVARRNINIPGNLTLIDFEPTSFLLTATRYYLVEVPIAIVTSGEIDNELEITNTAITPTSVELWIPEGTAPPAEIFTENIDVSNLTESAIVPINLVMPENVRPVNSDVSINVAITIERRTL